MQTLFSAGESRRVDIRHANRLAHDLQRISIVCIILVGMLFSNSCLQAQSTYATVSGFVSDATGAAISGATITLVNRDTQRTATTATQNSGEYRFADVDAGTYKISIQADGFNDYEVSNLTVLARQSVRLDSSLKVASGAATVVVVTADSALTSDSELITNSRSGSDIDQLALNFRATASTSPINVANLSAGVQPDASGNISVSGGLSYFTSFSIDGVSSSSVRSNGPIKDLFPSVDAISEFKVNSANNDAEFGQPSDITVTTRGGGNVLHGSLYEFHQNAAFDAQNPFATSKAKLVANDFGGNFSGPITIPHLYRGNDKSFIFFSYEGDRRPEGALAVQTVPSDDWRSGNLSSLGRPIYNVLTGQFQTQFPVSSYAAAALQLLYPRANRPGDTNNLVENIPGNYTQDGIDFRLDHTFTPSQKVYARFGGKDILLSEFNGTNSMAGNAEQSQKLRNVTASYSWLIHPTLINELRGGYSLANQAFTYPSAGQGIADTANIGLTVPATPRPAGGLPYFDFFDSSTGLEATTPGLPDPVKNFTVNVSDGLTYLHGKHTFKAGVDYAHLNYEDTLYFNYGDYFGEYYFGSLAKGADYGFADFLLGVPAETDYASDGPNTRPYTHSWGFYAQDTWKTSEDLTLSFGLRYEIHAPFNDATHQLANFDRKYPGGRVIVQGAAGLKTVNPTFEAALRTTPLVTNSEAGMPETLRNTYWGDVDPRLGFSYRVFHNDKTVFHAGVGAYTVPVLGSVLYSLAGVASSYMTTFVQGETPSPIFLPGNPFPVSSSLPPKNAYHRANQFDLKDPRQIQWNASIEQVIGFQTTLHLSYTGSHTTQLIQSPDLNQIPANTLGYENYVALNGLPFNNFKDVLSRDNGPSAKYNAGTAEISRHYQQGVTFDASYTLTHSTSNALGSGPSAFTTENGPNTLNRFDLAADYGNVLYNSRDRFVSTVLYDLPFGKGKLFLNNSGRTTDEVLGGWNIAGVILAQSGPFLTPTFSGTDPSGTGAEGEGRFAVSQRPDLVPGQNPNHGSKKISNYFNAAAFSTPQNNIGRFGNASVGILNGPGTFTLSSTITKTIPVTERLNLRYEAAFSNLLNHVNYAAPNTNTTGGSFGVITNVQDPTNSNGSQAGPRNIQMSLRVAF